MVALGATTSNGSKNGGPKKARKKRRKPERVHILDVVKASLMRSVSGVRHNPTGERHGNQVRNCSLILWQTPM